MGAATVPHYPTSEEEAKEKKESTLDYVINVYNRDNEQLTHNLWVKNYKREGNVITGETNNGTIEIILGTGHTAIIQKKEQL